MALILVLALAAAGATARGQNDVEPNEAVSAFNNAQDLHEKNDLTGAIAAYRNALKILPEFPEAEYQLGVAQLALNKTAEAESSFRRAVELRPDWSLAINGLVSVLLLTDNKEQLEEAQDLLRRVLEADPQNPPALAALAELSLRTSATPQALKDLLARIAPLTVKSNPTPALWTSRAALELALGQTDAAKSSVANALKIDPAHRNALLLAADMAIAAGDINKAKAIAETLAKGNAGSDSTILLEASILAAEGKLDDAFTQLGTIRSPSAAASALRERILVYRTTAPADLEIQLEADGKNAALLGRLCTLYRRDDPAKSIDYCRRASEAEPHNINHAIGFGAALVQARKFEPAVNVLRKIVAVAPDNTTARANLATALYQLKRYPESKAEFQWLVNAQPKAAAGYFFLGIIHDHLGEYLDAVANYQQYLRLSDPVEDRLDIDRVNLRMPALQKFVKKLDGKRN
jgi:tetratricopeptide (TPR) repeat protein